jgi:ankyrin repeat protein
LNSMDSVPLMTLDAYEYSARHCPRSTAKLIQDGVICKLDISGVGADRLKWLIDNSYGEALMRLLPSIIGQVEDEDLLYQWNYALRYACEHHYLDVVELILKEGRIFPKERPFLVACQFGTLEIVQLFLQDEHLDHSFQDSNGKTSLHYACEREKGSSDIVAVLLAKDAINPNLRDSQGLTPFLYTCEKGTFQSMKLLMNHHSVDIFVRNLKGSSALHLAVRWIDPTFVEVLLQDGRINPNVINNLGQTPLMSGIFPVYLEAVKVLLMDPRVDVTIRDQHGHTALDIAQRRIKQSGDHSLEKEILPCL